MAAKKAKASKAPRGAYIVELRRLRLAAYLPESAISSRAGCTVALYRAMELREVPVTRAVYDAGCTVFPQLKKFPPPPPDPAPVQEVVHPAVQAELYRISTWEKDVLQLNCGMKNKQRIKSICKACCKGEMKESDVDHYII
jgi:hypothetical protein